MNSFSLPSPSRIRIHMTINPISRAARIWTMMDREYNAEIAKRQASNEFARGNGNVMYTSGRGGNRGVAGRGRGFGKGSGRGGQGFGDKRDMHKRDGDDSSKQADKSNEKCFGCDQLGHYKAEFTNRQTHQGNNQPGRPEGKARGNDPLGTTTSGDKVAMVLTLKDWDDEIDDFGIAGKVQAVYDSGDDGISGVLQEYSPKKLYCQPNSIIMSYWKKIQQIKSRLIRLTTHVLRRPSRYQLQRHPISGG